VVTAQRSSSMASVESLQRGVGNTCAGWKSDYALGYSAGRKTTIDVTDLISKQASIGSLLLFAQPQTAWAG
jgi:hypothetical protein